MTSQTFNYITRYVTIYQSHTTSHHHPLSTQDVHIGHIIADKGLAQFELTPQEMSLVLPGSVIQDPALPISCIQDQALPESIIQDPVLPASSIQDPALPEIDVEEVIDHYHF